MGIGTMSVHDPHEPGRRRRLVRSVVGWAAWLIPCAAVAAAATGVRAINAVERVPRYSIQADAYWRLNLPDREPFGASGLVRTSSGDLLAVHDRGTELFRIEFGSQTNVADLVMDLRCFTDRQVEPAIKGKPHTFDAEGLALDEAGRLYVCDEADRWVLCGDPKQGRVERIGIDWSAVRQFFSDSDRNASFEGIAVHGDRLYLANERSRGRIIVVDLPARKAVDSFVVRSSSDFLWDVHYSDLSWHDGSLWVLLRESRAILRVEPESHRVLAEYDFSSIERVPEHEYRLRVPLAGVMEGLAVDDQHFWLVTDNNNLGRVQDPKDTRPTLFRCPR